MIKTELGFYIFLFMSESLLLMPTYTLFLLGPTWADAPRVGLLVPPGP